MEQITLPGVIHSLPEMSNFLNRNAEQAALGPKASARLHLAVDEIVTNIITHGYAEQDLTGEIILKAEITPDALTITTEDTAPPFDPRNRPKPASLTQSLEERAIGGLGIYLTLKNVDRFDYAWVNGKNRNSMVFNRSSATAELPAA